MITNLTNQFPAAGQSVFLKRAGAVLDKDIIVHILDKHSAESRTEKEMSECFFLSDEKNYRKHMATLLLVCNRHPVQLMRIIKQETKWTRSRVE